MRTPVTERDESRQGYLSENNIGAVLYSVSKRAKGFRDKLLECKAKPHLYSQQNLWDCEDGMRECYQMKKSILSRYQPKEIHAVQKYSNPRLSCRESCWKWDDYCLGIELNPCRLCMEKEEVRNALRVDYYLYYEVGDHSFHSPVTEDVVKDSGLNIVEIDHLNVSSEVVEPLLPESVCTDVYSILTPVQ